MNTDVQRQLDALRADYLAGLPARLDDIASACERLLAGELDEEGRVALRYAVHRLAGSAGSFGLDRLGRHAREAEARIDAILERPEAGGAADGAALREHLAAMRAAVPARE